MNSKELREAEETWRVFNAYYKALLNRSGKKMDASDSVRLKLLAEELQGDRAKLDEFWFNLDRLTKHS